MDTAADQLGCCHQPREATSHDEDLHGLRDRSALGDPLDERVVVDLRVDVDGDVLAQSLGSEPFVAFFEVLRGDLVRVQRLGGRSLRISLSHDVLLDG